MRGSDPRSSPIAGSAATRRKQPNQGRAAVRETERPKELVHSPPQRGSPQTLKAQPPAGRRRLARSCPSVERDQVLEDQPTPTISARLDEQSTFGKPAKFDRRETELFGKRANFLGGAVIVAG